MSHPAGPTLWLVRHAQPLVAPGICYGQTDVPADPAATRLAADALAQQLPPKALVLSSPLSRALDLAQALCQRRTDLQDAGTDPQLMEMDFGRWEMRPWASIPPAELEEWTRHFTAYRCGGGESTGAFLGRVWSIWGRWSQLTGPVVWVTHAGVVRAVLHIHSRVQQGLAPCPLQASEWPTTALAYGGLVALETPFVKGLP